MKRVVYIPATLAVIAAVLGFAVYSDIQDRNARALWLNYSVNDLGTISLVRPDLPEPQPPANLISIVQLPSACWKEFGENWEPGMSGGIAFGNGWCRVYPGQMFSIGEAAQHYRELKKLSGGRRNKD